MREPTQLALVSFELTTLSTTLEGIGLLLCSQKMLKVHPLHPMEASILPRYCRLNTPLTNAQPISCGLVHTQVQR